MLDGQGRAVVLAPDNPEMRGVEIASKYRHLTTALGGERAVSDIVPSAVEGDPIVAFALPLSGGASGVLSSGFILEDSPLKAFLERQPIAGTRGYILDSTGVVIVSAGVGSAASGDSLDLPAGPSGRSVADGRLVAAASISGTPWTYVLDAPVATVLAPSSSSETGEWVLLAGLAALTLAGLLVAAGAVASRGIAREQKAEADRRFRLTVEHAPIGMTMVSLDYKFVEPNTRLCQMLGYSVAELEAMTFVGYAGAEPRGLTFQDITHPEDLNTDLQLLERLLAGEIPSYDMEKRYITASGATVLVLLSVTLVRGDRGEPGYFVAQIQDITERKAQQAALRDLVEMLSHDLRTPMSVVTGYADLLVEEWSTLADDERAAFVRRVRAAGHAVQALLEDTLTVSAVDAKGIDCQPLPVRVDDVVREVVANVPGAAEAVDLSHLNAATALVDRSHLTQILTNLVTNAVKYGSGAFAISSADQAGNVQVEVRDTGRGVPPAFVPHLFDRYSRSDDARTGPQRGTGLGLYIVRSLVDLNGGEIRHHETPGGGATFIVRLPRTAPDRVREPIAATT